jgi:hypothetical protein
MTSVEEDAPVADGIRTSDDVGSVMGSRDGIESEESEFTDESSKSGTSSACGISSSDPMVIIA